MLATIRQTISSFLHKDHEVLKNDLFRVSEAYEHERKKTFRLEAEIADLTITIKDLRSKLLNAHQTIKRLRTKIGTIAKMYEPIYEPTPEKPVKKKRPYGKKKQ